MSDVLVAVASHADDAEINGGGYMSKWVAEGGEVHIILVTNNCSGEIIPEDGNEEKKKFHLPAETREIRLAEQDKSASLIGARIHKLDYCQRHYWDGERRMRMGHENLENAPEGVKGFTPLLTTYQLDEEVKKFGELLTGLKPKVVLTQSPLDIDPEHHATVSLVWQAFRDFREDLEHTELLYWGCSTSSPFGMCEAKEYKVIDITEYYEKKVELCACHFSQMTTYRWEIVKSRAETAGKKIGVQYGEEYVAAKRVFWE
ncbi:MAG: PIG-L deacetylase family protein [Planctomycetota bacterium]|jgi:LmbE family N-acetylglucosaminyl deacetylase